MGEACMGKALMVVTRWAAAVVFGLAIAGPAAAEVAFESSRLLLLETECVAVSSIEKASEPVELPAGIELIVYGVNRLENPTHARVTLNWRRKWAPLSCGSLVDHGPAPDQPCAAFFDNDPSERALLTGRGDITPPPPELNAFDDAAATLCGAPGQAVAPEGFKAMLRAHPAVLERLRAFTGGRVFAKGAAPADRDAYLDQLADAWFGAKGFEHVFCGEPTRTGDRRERVGGLHFHGRYLRLQEAGQACRIRNFVENESAAGAIYTMGVSMLNADGGVSRFAVKGYGLTLSAEDLLKIGTRAHVDMLGQAEPTGACGLTVEDDGQRYPIVFVRKEGGVRTLYPDATPDPKRRACGDMSLE